MKDEVEKELEEGTDEEEEEEESHTRTLVS